MSLRCLIVDDSPHFLEAARVLLEQEGMRVVGVASTGEEAARQAADLRPDVTLIDIDLGSTSGFTVASALAGNHGVDAGRLVFISTHSEDEFAELIEASPAIGFVPKSQLSAQAIEQVLRSAGNGG
jgi:DNA-binding NarL/FixJ family response regulator